MLCNGKDDDSKRDLTKAYPKYPNRVVFKEYSNTIQRLFED